jgi:hypothetical protein
MIDAEFFENYLEITAMGPLAFQLLPLFPSYYKRGSPPPSYTLPGDSEGVSLGVSLDESEGVSLGVSLGTSLVTGFAK